MKILKITIVIFSLISCSSKNENQISVQSDLDSIYGTQLFDRGFLKYADSSAYDRLSEELRSSFNIYDDLTHKIVHIDAEALAEFNFNFFLPSLNKMLEKREFRVNVELTDNYEDTHHILVNGHQIKLYTNGELENNTFWESASRIFFSELNKQLKESNANEYLYLLYSGNDLHVLLLTKEEHKIIKDRYSDNPKEAPYVP